MRPRLAWTRHIPDFENNRTTCRLECQLDNFVTQGRHIFHLEFTGLVPLHVTGLSRTCVPDQEEFDGLDVKRLSSSIFGFPVILFENGQLAVLFSNWLAQRQWQLDIRSDNHWQPSELTKRSGKGRQVSALKQGLSPMNEVTVHR
jgi:hypothetical protein